jgi:hypothetical protein
MPHSWSVESLYERYAKEIGDARDWCGLALRQNPQQSLRSQELDPKLGDDPDFLVLQSSLRALIVRRKRLLGGKSASQFETMGRLLLCEYFMSLASGESESETNGFFDVMDRPPWDSWLGLFQIPNVYHPSEPTAVLVSWVPSSFIPMVDRAIVVNPYECIYWADQPPLE